jgi:hypothetical protein
MRRGALKFAVPVVVLAACALVLRLNRMFFITFLDIIKLFSSIDESYGVQMDWRRHETLNRASQNVEATWN